MVEVEQRHLALATCQRAQPAGLNNLRALPFVVPSCRFGVHKRAKKPRYALKVPDAVEYG
jgi:hypothetical protein